VSSLTILVVDTIAGHLGRVNNGNVITPDFEFEGPEIDPFGPAFVQLSTVLSHNDSGLSVSWQLTARFTIRCVV
jgi:hypothetical protein